MSRKSASLAEDHESDDDDENERSGAEVESGSGRLFAFPNEGYVKAYPHYDSLVDTAKVLYCKKLLGDNNALMATKETAAKSSLPSPHSWYSYQNFQTLQ